MLIGPTKHCKETTILEFGRYPDGGTAMLTVRADGQPMMKLTVSLGREAPHLRPDQVWLKTWAENEGVEHALVKAGVVTLTGVTFPVNAWGSLAVQADLTAVAMAELAAVQT